MDDFDLFFFSKQKGGNRKIPKKKTPYLKKCKFLWDYMKLGQVGIKVILREQKLQQMKPCFCFCCSLHICELLSVFLQFCPV